MKNSWLLNRALRLSLIISVLALLVGCISKAPKTAFYTLAVQSLDTQGNSGIRGQLIDQAAIGVGPITLPEYIRSSQIISFTGESRLHISANAAWAGDVNANLTRVMGLYLSTLLPQNNVQTFPWDSRARPNYQLILRFHQFGGVKGKRVTLDAQWQLINTQTKALAKQGRLSVSEPLSRDTTRDYIAGLNRAVQKMALALAQKM